MRPHDYFGAAIIEHQQDERDDNLGLADRFRLGLDGEPKPWISAAGRG